MASEPAEPTTRQRLIEKAHDALRTVAYDWSEPTTTDRGRIVTALAEAGLLTDPAQTAELEQLRESKRMSLEINQGWVAYRERTKARRREFLDKIARLTRERDERQAHIGAVLAKLNASDQAASWEAMYDLVVEAKTILRGWASIEPAGEAIPVEELRRAALVGDQPPAEEPTPERVPCGNPDRHCGRRGGSAHCGGCRDDEPSPLSGEALRDVEERDDAAGDQP